MNPPASPPRKKMVCIGIDEHHQDFGPLTGAVEDARRWESFFKEKLDFDVRLVTHDDLPRSIRPQGLNLLNLLDDEVSELEPGDLFGLFLATHGTEVKFKDGKEERLFTLPTTSRLVVEAYANSPQSQRFKTGGLFVTLNQLEEVTVRPGVQRFFILDTCRSVIDLNLPTANRRGERPRFGGETIDRALQISIGMRPMALPSPLTTINSCSNDQVAKEFKYLRGGAFTLAGIQVLRKRFTSRKPLRLDIPYVSEVEAEMHSLADELEAKLDGQRPHIEGGGVELWSMSASVRMQFERLSAEFEAQLDSQLIDAPPSACARDTLSRIMVLDIPQTEKDKLQDRLKQAAEEDRKRRDLEHDGALLARARSSDSVDDWNAVRYSARLDASRQVASETLDRLRRKSEDETGWRIAMVIRSVAAVDRYLEKFGSDALHCNDAHELRSRLVREESDHAEHEAWRLAEQSNTIEAYMHFISEWPSGRWMSSASNRLQRLREDEDWRAWQIAESANTIEAYERYSADWPNGKHAVNAQSRIAKLQHLARDAAMQGSAAQTEYQIPMSPLEHQRCTPLTETELRLAIADLQALAVALPAGSPHLSPTQGLLEERLGALDKLVRSREQEPASASITDRRHAVSDAHSPAQLRQVQEELREARGGVNTVEPKQREDGLNVMLEPVPREVPSTLPPKIESIPGPSNSAIHIVSTKAVPSGGSGDISKTIASLRSSTGLYPAEDFRDRPFTPELARIKPATILFGAAANDRLAQKWERPHIEVTLPRSFGVGKYPVTFAEFDIFCDDTKKPKPNDAGWGRGRRPVINVSWLDAHEYCAWLTRETKESYRLLSEAEWEHACGTLIWPSVEDDSCHRLALYKHTIKGAVFSRIRLRSQIVSTEGTAPVGTYLPNEYGLYDMRGNVWEWIADNWSENHSMAPHDGSPYLAESGVNGEHVLKGGAWSSTHASLRTSSRTGGAADEKCSSWGFRVARDLD